MKVLIYTPYLNIAGGGEQYILNFADCLANKHSVTFVWRHPRTLHRTAKRFSIDSLKFQVIPFLPPRNNLRDYDVLFFVSDGSVPFLPFGKSILLFMSPFTKVKGKSLQTQLKLKFINHVLCFSKYTKKHIDKEFGIRSKLIYPAVETVSSIASKQNVILSVGRFTTTMHHKRQDSLVQAFIDFKRLAKNWKLVLVGGTEKGSPKLISSLKKKAKGHDIEIKTNVSKKTLTSLYAQAKIYWHAAGFGSDLRVSPQKAEHFGISIVEAMGKGAVPVVFRFGGPREIVTSDTGFTWDTLKDLKLKTLKLMQNEKLLQKLQSQAIKRAQYFNKDRFFKKVYELIEN